MKSNIDPLLIKDLYGKYASDVKVDDKKIKKIEEVYGDNNKLFLKDFYEKYAPDQEFTDEKFNEISETYGLKKKEAQSSQESEPTSPQEPFDPIENRVEKYNMEIEELISNDEVINKRSEELQSKFQQMVQQGEFNSPEEANKQFNLALMEDETIKGKELEIARDIDQKFKSDLEAIENIENAKKEMDKPSVSLSAFSNLNRRFYELAPDLLDAAGIGAKFINNYVTEPLGIEDKVDSIEDTPTGRLAKSLRSTIQEATPAADKNTEKTAVQVGGAIGQVLSYAATGGAGQAAKVANLEKALQTGKGAAKAVKEIIKASNNRTSQIASGQMSTYGYKRAIDEGATEGEAFASAFTSAMIGKTEALPIGKMFSRLNSSTNGIVKRTLTGGFKGGAEELAQESMQTYLENLSAQQIYDSKADLFDDVIEAGEVGGYTGMILNAFMSAIAGKKAKLNNPKDIAKLEQVEQDALNLKSNIKERKLQAEQRALEKAEQIENEQEATGPGNTVDGEATATDSQDQSDVTVGEKQSDKSQPTEPEAGQAVQIEEMREGETTITPAQEATQDQSIDSDKKISKKEDGNYTYKNSRNEYNVSVKDGELEITDAKTGKKIDKYITNKKGKKSKNNTHRDIRKEFEESFKYDQGKTTQELDQQALDDKGMSVTEAQTLEATNPDQFVAEFSENPAEIAKQWDESRKKQNEGETLNPKDKLIAEQVGKINPESFNDKGDRNKVGQSIAKSYFQKEAMSLDEKAQSISTPEVEVTEQDIIDFMERYPNGPQQALNKRSEGQIALENKFSELTGLPLDKHRADIVKAQEQANKIELKEGGITPDNVDTYKDEFAEENYTEQDYAEWKRIKKEETKQAGNSSGNTEVQGRDESNQRQTTSKGEKSATRKELEKSLETGKVKESEYAQRRLADVKDKDWAKESVDKNKTYQESSLKKAEQESTRILKDFKHNLGEKEGLKQAFTLLKNNDFPAIMRGIVAEKLIIQMQRAGMKKEAVDALKYNKERGTDLGQEMRSRQSDASPESVLSLALTKADQKQIEVWEQAKAKNGNPLSVEVEKLREQVQKLEEQIKNAPPQKRPTKSAPQNKSKDLIKRAKEKRKEGLNDINNYFKKQGGQLNSGIPLDSELFQGIKKVFESYVLEFKGNTELAFQKLKRELKSVKGLEKENLDDYRGELNKDIQPTIDEVIRDEQVKVVQNFLTRNRKNRKIDEKVNKQRAEEIVDQFNDSKDADIQEFATLFDQEAGFNNLSQEQRVEIFQEVETISELDAEGKTLEAAKRWENLQNKLLDYKIEKYDIGDVIYDLWYTNTLSGLTTLRRSTFGSTLTTFMFNATRMVTNPTLTFHAMDIFLKPSNIKEAFKVASNVIRTGDSTVQFRDYKSDSPSYFKKVVNTPYDKLSAKNKAAKAFYSPVVYAYRTIIAVDAALTNFSTDFNYSVLEYNKFLNLTKNRKQAFNEMLKSRNDDKITAFKEQAKNEYEVMKDRNPNLAKQLGSSFPVKRYKEILNQQRELESIEYALRDAKKAAMVASPEGLLGWAYENMINKVLSPTKNPKNTAEKTGNVIKQGTRLGLFPFMRVFTNYMNMGLEYTPFGLLNAVDKIKVGNKTLLDNTNIWTVKGNREVMKFERQEKVTRAMLGTSFAALVFTSIFDMDDEEGLTLKKDALFKINGNMTGNWMDEKKIDGERKPWSIAIRLPNGEYSDYYSYLDNPMGLMLAPLGLMSDEKLYKDFDAKVSNVIRKKKDTNLASAFIVGALQYAMSQSFAQSFKDLNNLVNPRISDVERTQKKWGDFMLRPVNNLITPSLYKQLENQYKALNDIPEKQSQEWYSSAIKNIPLAQNVFNDYKYDVFGYPIIREFDVPFFPDIALKAVKDNLDYREEIKEWKLLRKYPQVIVSNFDLPRQINRNRNIDEEKRVEFMKRAGGHFSDYVKEDYESLNAMDAVDLQRNLNYLRTAAYKTAKSEMDLVVGDY